MTYLFLDVDGVINALDGKNKGDWDDFQKVKVWHSSGQSFNMRFSKKMCAALAALPVDIHWATTWEDEANEALWRHTGLNDYPVACRIAPGPGLFDFWWKWQAIKDLVLENPQPVVWLDDEAIPEFAQGWFVEHGIPALLILPDQDVGLTRAHLEEIRAFVQEHADQ